MADRQAYARVGGRWTQVSATLDALLIGELKRTGGTIAVTATTLGLGSTNMTGTGTISGFASLSATSIGGITEANLVDKSAAETVSGVWTFQRGAGDGASLIAKGRAGQTADTTVFEVQDSTGTVLMSVDVEGDLNVLGSQTFVGGTAFNGNVTFGDTTADTATFTGRIATGTDIIPQSDGSSDLGTDTLRYALFFGDRINCPLYTETDGAVDTAGTAVAVRGGLGGAASAGAGGIGGTLTVAAGGGGAGSGAFIAGAGAALTLAGGAAGADGGAGGNNGGALNLTGGAATGSGTAGAINIGETTTSAVNIATTVSTTTVSIGNTLSGALVLNSGGTITIGDGTAGAITVDSSAGISIDGVGASNFTTDSGALTLATTTSGTLAVTSAGALNFNSEAASTWTFGGNVVATQDRTPAANSGESGDDLAWTAGVGAAAGASVNAGDGGVITFTSGAGGNASATNLAGVGGSLALLAGTGGAAAAAGAGGTGGEITITAGAGGAANNPNFAGGVGGALTASGGAGAASDGTSVAGAVGGAVTVSGGTGGAGSNGAGSPGGVGGALTIQAGTGGASGGISGTGGNGATLTLSGGTGGAATGGTAGNGGDVKIDAGDGNTIGTVLFGSVVASDFSFAMIDNQASAFLVQQAANAYIQVDTTDASEAVSFGNATTNPSFNFLGTGVIDADNGTLRIPSGASLIVGGVTGSANLTGTNLNTLVDGGDASALHTHTGLAATDIKDTDWDTTTNAVAVGELAYVTGVLQVGKAIANGTTPGTEIVVGVVTASGEITYQGRVSVKLEDSPTVNDYVYLSETNAGQGAVTPPTGDGEFEAIIGIVADTNGWALAGDPVIVVLQIKEPNAITV